MRLLIFLGLVLEDELALEEERARGDDGLATVEARHDDLAVGRLAAELDRLADSYDAVADLLLAETVHQNVLGNHERAAAALGALDRQGRPPRVEFVRTPRTGKSYTQRLLVLIGDDAYPPSWPSPVRAGVSPVATTR